MITKENLDNLLGSLVFEPKGIDFTITQKFNPHDSEAPFNITVYFDPEKFHSEGNEFDEEYSTYLYEIEDYVNNSLRYLGSEGFEIVDKILYQPKSIEVYSRIKEKVTNAMPLVEKKFNEITGRKLPKFVDVKLHYNYDSNFIDDHIYFTFRKNSGIPNFEKDSKYVSLFFNILERYVETDTFIPEVKYI